MKKTSEVYGVVYFVGAQSTGPVKIGFTTDRTVSSRLSQLQTGSHEELVVLGKVDASPAVERAIHNLLSSHVVRGEWFEREPALAVCTRLNGAASQGGSMFASRLACASDIYITCESQKTGLEHRVAADLVYDVARDLFTVNTEHPLPFLSWLSMQIARDDPIGDLANDYSSDPQFPPLGNLETYLLFITERGVRSAVTRTVVDAWIECDMEVSSIIFPE